MSILAIDLGQSKSVYAFRNERGEERIGSFRTDRDAIRDVLTQLRPTRVVVEVCPLAASVCDVAAEFGIPTLVADTTQDAWQWRTVKRKTDRDDALKLLRLALLNQLNPVHIPSPAMRQWRALIRARETIVVAQTRCKIQIRALLQRADTRLKRGKSGWTQSSLDELRQAARRLPECQPTELWRGILELHLAQLELWQKQLSECDEKLAEWARQDARLRLAKSIPGVGVVAAATIVAVLDDARRFRNRRQVAAYAGLTPRRFQSGSIDRQGHISKRGSPLLRRVLNQAAWMIVRNESSQRDFYLRLSQGGRAGKRKRAIVAVMHKLLVVAWAILRDGQPWRSPAAAAPAA